jgi:rSAM/selenodomain-associated transferase 1
VDERAVLLLSKPAVVGRVKTRLIGAVGAAGAARLHEAFLSDLVAELAAGGFSVLPFWALEGGEALPAWPAGGRRQAAGDLGAKLLAAFAAVAGRARWAAAVGSDHPDLPAERFEEAFAALEAGADLAVGPTRDGGYYLIAGAPERVVPELFDGVAWSTPAVLAPTLARARGGVGWRVAELARHEDVDTPEDLDRLARRLAAAPEERCPGTRAVLADLGRLEAGRVSCAS